VYRTECGTTWFRCDSKTNAAAVRAELPQVPIDRTALEALFAATQPAAVRQIDNSDDAGAATAKTRKKNAVLSVLDAQVCACARVRVLRLTDSARRRTRTGVSFGVRELFLSPASPWGGLHSVRSRSGSSSLASQPSLSATSSRRSTRSMWTRSGTSDSSFGVQIRTQ
jgi:hypothetical protein